MQTEYCKIHLLTYSLLYLKTTFKRTYRWQISWNFLVKSFMRYLGFFEIGRRKFKTTRKNTILRKKNLAYSIIVHAIIIQKMVKGKYKCQMVLADV